MNESGPYEDAVSSSLGIVRPPSLHGAILALPISRSLRVQVSFTVYTAAPYALLEASVNMCNSECSCKTCRGKKNSSTLRRSTSMSRMT